jgi:hypothetical protein
VRQERANKWPNALIHDHDDDDDLFMNNVTFHIYLYDNLKILMWADHVVRMELHRIPKKVLGSCFGGGRPVERPRNRWEDVIQRNAANLLQIRNWKAAARDKEEWRKKVGEAMARKRAKAS